MSFVRTSGLACRAGLVSLVIAATTAAQVTPQQLVGGAYPPAAPGTLIQNQVFCTTGVVKCRPPILPPPPTPNSGGTAYDPGDMTIWDTNGVLLVGVSANPANPCAVVCPPFPIPFPGPVGVATGLAFNELNRQLYMIDSIPSISQWVKPATLPCPQPVQRCSLAAVIPAAFTPASLAISERNQLIYYTASNFGVLPAINVLFIAPLANPCVPVCRVQLPPLTCSPLPLGHITGAAYDDCRDVLYLTDGAQVIQYRVTPNCQIAPIACCAAPVPAPYYGLDIEPSHASPTGISCTLPSCPACPAMRLTANDPSIGNGAFALFLANAPAPSAAIGLIGPGPCTAGIPVLCGFYYPGFPPAPIIVPPVAVAGPGPCGGTAQMPVGVPLDPSLCGISLCAQAVVLCLAATPVGVGLTNGLDLLITDT